MKEYAPDAIPFETIKYRQDWMGEGEYIYSASTSKENEVEPTVFVVYPELESEAFEDEKDLMKIPEEYSIWRTFYKHKNGAKKITKLVYTTKESTTKSNTLKAIQQIKMIDFKVGDAYFLEIYFDNNQQKKEFDLRPELPIKIYI